MNSQKTYITMKKISLALVLLLAVLVGLTGCQPEEYVLQPAPSKIEGIEDTFVLSRVVQVDQRTLNIDNTLDISAVFVGESGGELTFDPEAGTFAFVPNTSIDFLGTSGTWGFDDPDYPSMIVMNNSTETYTLNLLRTIRPQDQLQVQLNRECSGEVSVSYQMYFERN